MSSILYIVLYSLLLFDTRIIIQIIIFNVIIRPLGGDAIFITHYRDSFINYSGEGEVVEILLPT